MSKITIGAALLATMLGFQQMPACSRYRPIPKTMTEDSAKTMRPYQEPAMEKGPLLFPKTDLKKALEATYGQPIHWKLPVTVQRDDLGQAKSAQIGLKGLGEEKDRLPIQLDDSGLGISLNERLDQYCESGNPCDIWVVGRWQKPLIAQKGVEFVFFIDAVVEKPADFSSDADAACVYKEIR
jgi:hypothetical protein